MQVPLLLNRVHGTFDRDSGAIPKSKDLAGMRPYAFTEIDNLVENCSIHKAKSSERYEILSTSWELLVPLSHLMEVISSRSQQCLHYF